MSSYTCTFRTTYDVSPSAAETEDTAETVVPLCPKQLVRHERRHTVTRRPFSSARSNDGRRVEM
jgi:hypothetical protein